MKRTIKIIVIFAVCGLLIATCEMGDSGDPGTPSDLGFICNSVTGASDCVTPDTRVLTWIASGDDGESGKALQYDIRWVTGEPMTEEAFDEAHHLIKEPEPKVSGSVEMYFLPRLALGEEISFGLKAFDEVARESGIVVMSGMATLSFLEMEFATPEFEALPAATPEFGAAVALIGDIDENEENDVAIGAPGEGDDVGSVVIYLATSIDNVITEAGGIPHVVESTPFALMIRGEEEGDRFGASISGYSDFNGDDINDFVVGAPGAKKVYIFFGGKNERYNYNDLEKMPDTPVMVNAADIADVIIAGPAGSSFGAAVELLGNINDGNGGELAVGAPEAYCVYLFYGGLLEGNAISESPITVDLTAGGWADWSLVGPAGSSFGYTLTRVADLDSDGIEDVAVGAPNIESVFIFYGGSREDKAIDFSAEGSQVWTYGVDDYDLMLQGPVTSEFGAVIDGFGSSSSSNLTAGSIAVGAPGEDKVYVMHGGIESAIGFPTEGSTLYVVESQGADYVIEGEVGTRFGESLSVRSDMDGNERSDVLVGAPLATDEVELGAVYVFYSTDDALNIRDIDDADVVFWGKNEGGRFGAGLSGVFNLIAHEGVSENLGDLVVGAPGSNRVFIEF